MQPGLNDFSSCICFQLITKPRHSLKHSAVKVFRIAWPKSHFLHVLNQPVGIERIHLQELSQAEAHWYMESKLFAQRLDVPLPI